MRRRGPAAFLVAVALAASLACGGGNGAVTAPVATPDASTAPDRTLPPQPSKLFLEVTSPANDVVVDTGRITIEGKTSPDATLSVDGDLVRPGLFGEFSHEFTPAGNANPISIEITASSVSGENASVVRTAIFTGPGVDPPDDRGVFGTVVDVTARSLTLETAGGEQTLAVSGEAMVRIPGWRSATPPDIPRGSPVAVLANGGSAVNVLVRTSQPYQYRHFTGLIVESPGEKSGTVIFDGTNLLSVMSGPPSFHPSPGPSPGDLVTMVLKQDLASGDLISFAIDPADDSLARLETSLETYMEFHKAAGVSENLQNLKKRLAEHSNRHLSLLFQAGRSAESPAKEGAEAVFDRVRRNHDAVLSKFGLEPSTVQSSGIVSSIDSSAGRKIIVDTGQSGPVVIELSTDTPIEFLGEDLTFSQLDLASRVTVRFGAESAMARWVHVHPGNVLTTGAAEKVLSTADRGEAEGTLLEFTGRDGSPSVALQRRDGLGILEFQSPPGAQKPAMLLDGSATEAGPQLAGSAAFALYDPDTLELLELDAISSPGSRVSGVVQSFIPKVLLDNMTLRRTDGSAGSFNHNEDTIVRRNGQRVSINEVQVGDIVRPNTRYELDGVDRVLTVLSLKAPGDVVVAGSIRGINVGADGSPRITIVTARLDILTLTVPPSAGLIRRGQPMDTGDLAVGQEVASGFYNPVSGLVTSLNIG